MSNKPRIFANCPAGCKWETVHKDDFLNSASIVEMMPNDDGSFDLEVGKTYKLLESGTDIAWRGKIQVAFDHYEKADSGITYRETVETLAFPTKNKFYNDLISVKVLGFLRENNLEEQQGFDFGENLYFELNGKSYKQTAVSYGIGVDDFRDKPCPYSYCTIKATGFQKCFRVNEDARIALDANTVKSTVLIGQDENGGNIYEQTFGDGTKVRFVAPKGQKGLDGITLDGCFAISVDENNDLYVYYREGDEPPNIMYDEETGNLYQVFESDSGTVEKLLGNVKGEKGDKGDKGDTGEIDLPLEKGFNSNYETESIQQVGTSATGWRTFTTGHMTQAKQKCARADGWRTVANAEASYAGGRGTHAIVPSQFVIGDFNEENEEAAFQIGNGEDGARSTLFEVLKNGIVKSGNKTLATTDNIPDVSNFATKDEIPESSVDETAVREIVEECIKESGGGGNVDLSGYALKDEIPDTSNFATKDEVNDMVTTPLSGFFTMKVDTNGDLYAYSENDLSNFFKYVTEDNIEDGETIGDLYYMTEQGE